MCRLNSTTVAMLPFSFASFKPSIRTHLPTSASLDEVEVDALYGSDTSGVASIAARAADSAAAAASAADMVAARSGVLARACVRDFAWQLSSVHMSELRAAIAIAPTAAASGLVGAAAGASGAAAGASSAATGDDALARARDALLLEASVQ